METKCIFSPQLAKFLVSKGYLIVDLKLKRETKNETVFVFAVEDGLYDAIEEWMN